MDPIPELGGRTRNACGGKGCQEEDDGCEPHDGYNILCGAV